MKSIFLTIFLFLLYPAISAQVDTCYNRITSFPNNDEDSWIMQASDGNYYVAFFSDSLPTPSILITRSTDGALTWDTTWIAIAMTDSCYYPCLKQAPDGTFHMTFFTIAGGAVDVFYTQSADAFTWTTPLNLTMNPAVDWMPNLLIDHNGFLIVTYASDAGGNMDIYFLMSTDGGATWSPAPGTFVTHPYQDNMPYLYETYDSTYVLTWQRYNDSPYNYLSATNEIFYKTTASFGSWSADDSITYDTSPLYTDILPAVYQNPLDSEIYITWTTNRFLAAGNNVELSMSGIAAGALGHLATEITCNGYYARSISGDTLGQIIITWVADPGNDGVREIYLRFMDKTNSVDIYEYDNAVAYTLFPNPFSTQATLKLDNLPLQELALTLYNSNGQQVHQLVSFENTFSIQRNRLEPGLYLFNITGKSNLRLSGKITVE